MPKGKRKDAHQRTVAVRIFIRSACEQRFNAADVVGAGGGLLVDDADLTPEWLDQNLLPLLRDRDRLEAMARAAASEGERGADELLADLVDTAFTKSGGGRR